MSADADVKSVERMMMGKIFMVYLLFGQVAHYGPL